MSAPQRIGYVTLAQCDRDQIRALAFAKNVIGLDTAETETEFRYRTEALQDFVRSIPPRYRELYANKMQMRWAWLRIRDDLREAGILKGGAP